ncbi:MAG: YdeI/OmpD-associated family protein [Bacteroidetes bacterium]|nr:YdeI/OmpD-associated family protein [Bacteroidota bacterium]
MNPKVDFYFNKDGKWQEEIKKMRTIALDCQLTEELKWGVPSYSHKHGNIVLIHVFKEYCAYLFFKGVLLKDSKKILIQQTPQVQSARQLRFSSLAEIVKLEKTIKAYIFEAIEVEKAGLKVPFKKTEDFPMPEEFELELKRNPNLKKAFKALTPGRQRGYLLYFAAAKQIKTKIARIEKYIPIILSGKGLDD